MSDNAGTNFFNTIANAAKDIYTSNRETAAAQAQARATTANATASIMSSKNLMIAGVVIAVAVVAFIMFRKK